MVSLYESVVRNRNVDSPDLHLTEASGDSDYLAAMHAVILPVAHSFQPDIVLVAAGACHLWSLWACAPPSSYTLLLDARI